MKHLFFSALMWCGALSVAQADVITLNYGGFKLKYECSNRTALRYEYSLGYDNGSAARPSSFYLDPNMPAGCNQQYTTGTTTRTGGPSTAAGTEATASRNRSLSSAAPGPAPR